MTTSRTRTRKRPAAGVVAALMVSALMVPFGLTAPGMVISTLCLPRELPDWYKPTLGACAALDGRG